MFKSEAYTLQENTTVYGKIITSGELVVKQQYICSIKESTNWFWDRHPQQQVITVPIRTTITPQIGVITITDSHGILKSVCNRKQVKKSISRHPIRLTDSDYHYILEEIDC